MSEVYIRSQNKEKLYRLGGNYACVEYGEYEDIKKKRGGAEADKKRHVICISDGCLEEIGEYATKERCLEVLDEIQKACVSYLFRQWQRVCRCRGLTAFYYQRGRKADKGILLPPVQQLGAWHK